VQCERHRCRTVHHSKQPFCRPVVILCNKDKEEMDEELRGALKGFKLEWHTRTGVPHSISDLKRVAAGQAKNVILLNPDDEEVPPLPPPRGNPPKDMPFQTPTKEQL